MLRSRHRAVVLELLPECDRIRRASQCHASSCVGRNTGYRPARS